MATRISLSALQKHETLQRPIGFEIPNLCIVKKTIEASDLSVLCRSYRDLRAAAINTALASMR